MKNNHIEIYSILFQINNNLVEEYTGSEPCIMEKYNNLLSSYNSGKVDLRKVFVSKSIMENYSSVMESKNIISNFSSLEAVIFRVFEPVYELGD